jgi:hypothetical protein
MSYHQGASQLRRAHWLAIEFVFYLLALLTLGAQVACLLTSCPTKASAVQPEQVIAAPVKAETSA